MRIFLAIFAALALVIGSGSYYKNQQAKRKTQEAAEQVAQEAASKKAAEESAKNAEEAEKKAAEQDMRVYFNKLLVDPGSVQFRDLKIYLNVPTPKLRTAGTGEVNVVCGEYNSKNRLGGYVGFKYFYWDSEKKEAFQSSDSLLGPMMEEIALKTCASLN